MQRIEHSLVAKCYDVGCDTKDGGVVWFVMEWIEGSSLDDLLLNRGPLKVAEACR